VAGLVGLDAEILEHPKLNGKIAAKTAHSADSCNQSGGADQAKQIAVPTLGSGVERLLGLNLAKKGVE